MTFIKRIDMTGFKSYGRGTISLLFGPGFTGIIGPNGSGKSNIVDAISFTLGELSSKSMRAKDLRDLIYSGTGGDKPAENASVNIVFDNSDKKIPVPFDEVTVQRDIKRKGGGSVYRFNGKRSTRTEIMDKLKIANIDVKEGFNLVLQGRIAELAAMNPDERRELIEDLAGTNEFDEKKIASISELEKAEIKLNELELLLKETEANVKRLEKEKKDVEEWELIVEQIFENKTKLYSFRHSSLVEELKNFQTQNDDLVKQIKEVEEEKNSKIKILKDVSDSIQNVKNQINKKQSELEAYQNEISNLKSSITGLKRDIAHREKRIKEMNVEKEETKSKIEEIKKNQEKLNQEVSEIDTKLKEIGLKRDEEREQQTRLNNLIKKSQTQFETLQKRSSEIQKQIDMKTKKLNNLEIQKSMKMSGVEVKQTSFEEKKRQLESRKRTYKQNLDAYRALELEIVQSQELLQVADNRVKSSHSKKSVYDEKLDELYDLKSEIEKKTSSLEAKIETIQSFFEEGDTNPVIKKILEKKTNKEIIGIIGRFGDLLNLEELSPNEKAALIPYLNSIVVDSSLTAAEIIQTLRDEQIGYGNFIPLEELGEIIYNNDLPFKFLETLDKKMKAMAYIFNNTVVTEDLHSAINIFMKNIEEKKYGAQILTLEGDKISREGIISGGASPEFAETQISGLKKQLEELKKEEVQVNQEHELTKMKLGKLNSLLTEVQRKQENVKQSIKNKQDQMEALKKRLEDDEFHINRIGQEIQSLKLNIEAITTLMTNIEAEKAEVEKSIAVLKEEKKVIDDEIEKTEMTKLLDEVRKVENDLSKLEITFSKNDAIKTEKLNQINVILEKNIKEKEAQVQNLNKMIDQAYSEINKFKTEKANAEKNLITKTTEEEDIKKQITDLENSISEKQNEIESKRNESNSLSRKIDRIREQINDIKINQERAKTELTNIQAQIKDEEIEIIEIKGEVNEKKLETEIKDLMEKKRSLEPVNALAIKQFHEANQRYQDLKSKHEELQEERKIIVDFINKIEYEKENVFMDIFNKINKEFGKIFNMIAGGRAWMELENEENPFEGGITINAEPHGKKVKSVRAMSGGEKSLTALSLIFAMQKVEPSPFYILDEIDAALDVMNVRRVAKVIEKMSKESQCILITHRDIAMRYADLLYGVTNVKGISKVVSVEMTDDATLKQLSS
ncbi:MAG: chromosome segregation protein SMC [Candidatus Helarchaeota archaeon]